MRGAMERRMILLVLAIAISATLGWASENQGDVKAGSELQRDPTSLGKPLSYWLKSIKDLDRENMDLAFQAIVNLGPDAWPAVPQLTQIVAEPFTPIELNVDDYNVVVSKLVSIQIRGDAIDALAAIGEAAASSAVTLMNWGLTLRVLPGETLNRQQDDLFVDLVVIDVVQRMRVAGAILAFGADAYPAVAALLKSPDSESRKLAVAILGENSPMVASVLSKSRTCEERKLGISILFDLWPVIAREYLNALKGRFACDQTN